MNDDKDPNKIITSFADCRGTCKTPIGCTCGSDEETESGEEGATTAHKEVKMKSENEASIHTESSNEQAESSACSRRRKDGSMPCCLGANKLEVYNWLENTPNVLDESKMVEVQFKNTRKGYYINSNDLELYKGDIVAVEATPGHDIGEVTLTGKLVELQMKKMNFRGEVKRVYRKAKPADMEKYQQAKAKEHQTMLRAREIAEELKLEMKISDVEYQGDSNKAIFYYIADGRVDFRQLIKHYASEFRIKIEMKQIGARQEAGRVGGIGPCGRELCCSSSMSNFVSVSTQAARLQDIPLNPQKLAGQCGKLKCCLNFEVDTYVEAQRGLPSRDAVLETKDSSYFHLKTDILSGTISYSTDKHFAVNVVALPKDRVFEIIKQNRKGEKPLSLIEPDTENGYANNNRAIDVLEQESITRFDTDRRENRNGQSQKKSRRKKRNPAQDDQRGLERREGATSANNSNSNKSIVKNDKNKKPESPQPQQNNNRQEKSADKSRRQKNRRPNLNNNNNGNRQEQQAENRNPESGRKKIITRNKRDEADSQK